MPQEFIVRRINNTYSFVQKRGQCFQMLTDCWISAQTFENSRLFDGCYAAKKDIELLPHLRRVNRIGLDFLYKVKKFNLRLNQRPLHIV
ncbi:hypothetical protein [Yoonia rosea]|uniref:hypothetical protein n=1 Tax=Yoonia rosea TaxID=287098 RepID=UPI001F6085F1|nr:hypothetical protein [Yoonia rosea]